MILQDTSDSPLGKAALPMVQAHPGKSGVFALADGRDAFAARVLLADASECSLDVQYYIWNGDKTGTLLFEALRRAADRGVRVRLLLDDNNIAGLDTVLAALNSHPNIEVRLFNPFMHRRWRVLSFLTDFRRLNRRMHNKSFIVDRQACIIGGRNVGDEYFDAGQGLSFVDLDVLAIGTVVEDVSVDFERYWTSESSYPAERVLARVSQTVYVFGCVVQGAAIIGFGLMGWLAQMFSGTVAGIVAVLLIAVFALGRSLCSISHKDVLGKTVDRGRRGSVSGTAGTIAAVLTLLLALAYSMGWIALSGDSTVSGLGTLGPFMIASASASLVSAYVWGRLADRSSRRVLMLAATLTALANAIAAALALAMPQLLGGSLLLPALLFVLMIAHQGVRLGRSVHVVDMADPGSRATYTALSNSVVGLILLAGGVFGVIAQWLGIGAVLAIFTLMAALAIRAAAGLDEVQAA